jgi:hypothetical protein
VRDCTAVWLTLTMVHPVFRKRALLSNAHKGVFDKTSDIVMRADKMFRMLGVSDTESGVDADAAGRQSDGKKRDLYVMEQLGRLFTPVDFIGCTKPDLVLAWLASLSAGHFGVVSERQEVLRELQARIADVVEQCNKIAEVVAAGETVSPEWLLKSVDMFSDATTSVAAFCNDVYGANRAHKNFVRKQRLLVVEILTMRDHGLAYRSPDFSMEEIKRELVGAALASVDLIKGRSDLDNVQRETELLELQRLILKHSTVLDACFQVTTKA